MNAHKGDDPDDNNNQAHQQTPGLRVGSQQIHNQQIHNQQSVFDTLGGTPWFVGLIDRFYTKVETDQLLRPLYPEDLTESRDHMVKFLVQYWGGPGTYSQQRGHPRLRMRHAPFPIGVAERDAWFNHMVEALNESNPPADIKQQMVEHFDRAATHMINTN